MKMTNYISQLSGKEQNAVFCIKKLITARIQPLLIYFFGCETTVTTKRSAFITRQFKEVRHFTCDLLIITADEALIDDALKTDIQEMTAHFGKVSMLIHPLGFMTKQMNEGNLFFNWVRKNGMLLFERNAATQFLPAVIGGEYKQQAQQFYEKDAQMSNYLEERFQAIANPASQKKSNGAIKPVEIRLTLDAANGWQPIAAKEEMVTGSGTPAIK